MAKSLDLEAIVLAHKKDQFESKEGQTINYSTVTVRIDQSLVKFSALKDLDFSPALDQTVILSLSITADSMLKPKIKVVSYRMA